MSSLIEDLRKRDLIYQVTSEKILPALDGGQVRFYAGFDPSNDSLHVGNLLILLLMYRLRLVGNSSIVLLGTFTGLIGDPSGKQVERKLLDKSEVLGNSEAIYRQIKQLFDNLDEIMSPKSPGELKYLENSEWLGQISLEEFLRDCGKYLTINSMISKDSVRERLKDPDKSISYAEFSYMLLQALDFRHLCDQHGCTLQIGASDQWGNITAGIELIKKSRNSKEVFGLTCPLLVKDDGTKFGKSESGAIWLDPRKTSPFEFYQFFYRTEDKDLYKYLKIFTFLPTEDVSELLSDSSDKSKTLAAKELLAKTICSYFYGESEANKQSEIAKRIFTLPIRDLSESEINMLASSYSVLRVGRDELNSATLGKLFLDSGIVDSKGQLGRLLTQHGLKVNDMDISDLDSKLTRDMLMFDRYAKLSVGKKKHVLVEVL